MLALVPGHVHLHAHAGAGGRRRCVLANSHAHGVGMRISERGVELHAVMCLHACMHIGSNLSRTASGTN